MAYYFYGLRAVLVAGVSVLSSVFADYLCVTAMRKKYDWSDTSPIMSGLLLALLMPASIPYTVMAFSAAFMASVCKHAFGGNKNLIFCPVCISYIFTTFCFPSDVVRYPTPEPFGSLPLANTVGIPLARSYTYAIDSGSASTFSILDIVWGKLAGPMGTSAALIILICAIALYFFRNIPTVAFFSGFGANILINVIFPVGEPGWYAVLNSLVAGSYFFVLTFMACDPRYVPKRAFSQLTYGCLLAGASYLIRANTSIENGAVFALPMLCIFRDEFDRLSGALERLLRFLWKWLGIISRFIWKYLKIFSVWLSKQAYASFMRLCDIISDGIVSLSKKHAAKKEAEAKAAEITDKKDDAESVQNAEAEPLSDGNGSDDGGVSEQESALDEGDESVDNAENTESADSENGKGESE